jgi:hypothetical protein
MCGFCTIPKTQSTDPPSSRRLPVKCDGSLPLDERTSNVHRGLSPIAQRPPHWSRTGKHVRNGTIEFSPRMLVSTPCQNGMAIELDSRRTENANCTIASGFTR